MTSSLNKDAIFQSLPKSVTIGSTPHAAHVEYADRGKTVSELLKDHPLVITLRYYGDHQDKETTPGNRRVGRDIVDSDIQYKIGQNRLVTLSINVHAKDQESLPADTLINAYVEILITWLLQDLPEIVEVVDDTGVSDISYLENETERRQMDVILRYEHWYKKTVGSIDTVDTPDITLA